MKFNFFILVSQWEYFRWRIFSPYQAGGSVTPNHQHGCGIESSDSIPRLAYSAATGAAGSAGTLRASFTSVAVYLTKPTATVAPDNAYSERYEYFATVA